MRDIKFSYMYQHEETGTWIDLSYTLDEIEKGLPARQLEVVPRFKLIAKRQYTGLKDANGVEIYEGDICVNTNGRLAKCIYHEPSASFDFVASYLTGLTRLLQMLNCGYSAQMSGKLIVIGNIYENPELLNKEIQND